MFARICEEQRRKRRRWRWSDRRIICEKKLFGKLIYSFDHSSSTVVQLGMVPRRGGWWWWFRNSVIFVIIQMYIKGYVLNERQRSYIFIDLKVYVLLKGSLWKYSLKILYIFRPLSSFYFPLSLSLFIQSFTYTQPF